MGNTQDTVTPNLLQTVQIECHFWQRGTLMLKMLIHFIHNIPQKETVMSQVACWCRAMSVSNIISTESIHTINGPIIYICIWSIDLYPSQALCQSRTSDPSPKELQKLREAFNPANLCGGVIALTIQTWHEILPNRSQELLDSRFIGNRRTETTIDTHPCKHSRLWDILSQISRTTPLRFVERYISLGLSFVLPSQLLWEIPGKHAMLQACRMNLHLSSNNSLPGAAILSSTTKIVILHGFMPLWPCKITD